MRDRPRLRRTPLLTVSFFMLAALAFAGTANATAWKQFQFNGKHSGVNPAEHVLAPQNVAELESRWSTFVGSDYASVIAANGIVYASGDHLVALRASSGSVLWTAPGGNLAVSQGRVISVGNGRVRAFDAVTGDQMWNVAVANGLGGPAVADGKVFVAGGGSGAHVFALDLTSGDRLWKSDQGSGEGAFFLPAIADGQVFAAFQDDHQSVFDERTGDLVGGFSISGSDEPAVVAGGRVYFGGFDRLYGFSIRSGVQGKFFDPGAQGVTPVVSDGTLYQATESSFQAIDIRSENRIWRVPFDATGCPPVLANGVIYVGSGMWVDAIDATTGQLLNTWYTGRPVRRVIVTNGRVISISDGYVELDALPA
ncbi:MAG: PQQ-binding-like beta-propeller repeat protein [Actinomycetota bacterium]